MKHLNENNFKETVYFSDNPCAVLFTAPWCGFCKSMKLMCEKAQEDFSETDFYTVDIDAEQSLKNAYGVSAVPTLIVFEDGTPVSRASGLLKKGELYSLLGSHTASLY